MADGSRSTLEEAFDDIKHKWPEEQIDVGVENSGLSSPSPEHFLDKIEVMLE